MTDSPTASPSPAAPPMARVPAIAILLALIAGGGSGLLLATQSPALTQAVIPWADMIGSLWLHGLQMTIIPLVVSLLITGIVQSVAAARAGRVAGLSIACFFAVLWGGAIMAAIVTPLLLDWFPIPAEAARGLMASLGGAQPIGTVPPFTDFIKAMVPTNPVNAAANDAILPLIVFTVVFALAITRLEAAQRVTLVSLFEALANAMLVVISWVLALAPIGVFALALLVAAQTGAAAIGLFAHYIILVSAVGLIVWAAAYPIAIIGGRQSLGRFARAVIPAQAVALSTQSSLASLPAMLRGTQALGLRASVADVTLPLAVALFRSTGPAMNLAVAIYVAYLTNTPVTPMTLAIGVAVAATTTLGSVSLPGSISYISAIAPIAAAMGVPLEPLALLVAVETLPDIVRTLGNVTNDVAAVAVVDARTTDQGVE